MRKFAFGLGVIPLPQSKAAAFLISMISIAASAHSMSKEEERYLRALTDVTKELRLIVSSGDVIQLQHNLRTNMSASDSYELCVARSNENLIKLNKDADYVQNLLSQKATIQRQQATNQKQKALNLKILKALCSKAENINKCVSDFQN